MRIGIFTDSYLPYKSGVSISIETQAAGLRELGHEVYIFAPYYPNAAKDPCVFSLPSLPAPYPNFRIALPFSSRINKIIPSLKLNIIHAHSPFQMGWLAKTKAKELGLPLVYTLHTLFEKYAHYIPLLPQKAKEKLISSYVDGFLRFCDSIIVPSDTLSPVLLEKGVKAPIEIVPTGINLALAEKFTGQGIRETIKIKKDAPLLIFCSRMAKEKNVPFLFDVFKLVLKGSPDCYLLMVGGGPMLGAYKALTQKEGLAMVPSGTWLAERIIFTGEIPYPEVFNYYAASDIFVFASETETQGLVIAEAKAKGLPAVVVDSPGTRKGMQNNVDGYLVALDKNIFSQKVIELLNSPQKRAQMGKAAKEFVGKELSAKVMAKKIEEIYKRLLG